MKIKYQIKKLVIKPGLAVFIKTEEQRKNFYRIAKSAGFRDLGSEIEVLRHDYYLETDMVVRHAELDYRARNHEGFIYMTYDEFIEKIED